MLYAFAKDQSASFKMKLSLSFFKVKKEKKALLKIDSYLKYAIKHFL